jgi:hypothetical protein
MADTSLGFRYRGRIYGDSNRPTIQDILAQDTTTLYEGDLVNLESGEVDLAATADTNLAGLVAETKAVTDSTTRIRVYTDADIIMGVYDPVARVKGATLDIAGAAGSMTIAASSNKELVVYADSGANEETLVVFNIGKHHHNKAQ